jgi:hypothetical protein
MGTVRPATTFERPKRATTVSDWTPIAIEELRDVIRVGERELDQSALRLWESIRIDVTKWQLHPWGDEGNGFWVVGLIGSNVLWYNDIEDGFNWSRRGGTDEQMRLASILVGWHWLRQCCVQDLRSILARLVGLASFCDWSVSSRPSTGRASATPQQWQ